MARGFQTPEAELDLASMLDDSARTERSHFHAETHASARQIADNILDNIL